MADLPARPDLDQLRHQARDLLRAAQRGDRDVIARIRAVSGRLILSSAQLALAREYGFASWAKLKLEVERRDVLNSRDLSRLTRLLAEHPELATTKMEHWCDHKQGADLLGYMAMLRFDHDRLGLPRKLPGTGAVARALIEAGAPVNGRPGDKETPDRLTTTAPARTPRPRQHPAGGAGPCPPVLTINDRYILILSDREQPLARFTLQSRIRALVFAADHQRLDVIDQLVEAGTPLNEPDAEWERLPLHTAAGNGQAASVRRLLAHGADPNLRDPKHHRTPLEECQPASISRGHREVEAILRPLTGHGGKQTPQPRGS